MSLQIWTILLTADSNHDDTAIGMNIVSLASEA